MVVTVISGGDNSSSYAKDKAFDNSITTSWRSLQTGVDVVNAAWLGQDFGIPVYVISASYRKGSYDPASVAIQYSDDGLSWTNTGVTFTSFSNAVEKKSIAVGTPHRYWRAIATGATAGTNPWEIVELTFGIATTGLPKYITKVVSLGAITNLNATALKARVNTLKTKFVQNGILTAVDMQEFWSILRDFSQHYHPYTETKQAIDNIQAGIDAITDSTTKTNAQNAANPHKVTVLSNTGPILFDNPITSGFSVGFVLDKVTMNTFIEMINASQRHKHSVTDRFFDTAV
jgi:hypothetical protein